MGLSLVAPVLPALALAGLPARAQDAAHVSEARSGSGGGAQLNAPVKVATRALSGAFLTRVFKRDDGARAAWPLQFADIVARYTRSPHEP